MEKNGVKTTENGAKTTTTEASPEKRVPRADGGMNERLSEEEDEEDRVDKLLDENEEEGAGVVPTLLGEEAAKHGTKQEQLDTLLNKAQQYSNFIVQSQQKSPGKDEEPRAKRRKTISDAAECMAKKEKLVMQPKCMVGGTLKGYQLEGLRWMATLYENGLSGILADEMGLGKTIQVIALVGHLREKNVAGPIIVAAPLATLPNWEKEFRKWTPAIACLLYHGAKKHRADLRKGLLSQHQHAESFPVIITSYEICIIDRGPLSHFDFKYLVVDEGQRVKNRDCRLVRELKKLKTENRLLLSGTPIQNTLEELWSLLNFVNPQIFDDLNVFQSWFGFRNIGKETQVDDILDDEARNRIVTKLHEILRPFLLRRVKADVLKDVLPPKKEIVVYTPMSRVQKQYERELLNNRLRDALVVSGVPAGNDISQANKLMNQRKIANHPFLFGEPRLGTGEYITDKSPSALAKASGKFALLSRLLPRLKDQGHKVLIFSQMTEVLNLLELLFQQMGYRFFRIDGGVKLQDRQRQIDEFNETDNDNFIFMLSTRAGGLGINLAAADTCIIFDSDWNPQQDSQAMDRCHRIGQTKPVLVFRLLTNASVEIQMMDKQISKKKLERMAIAGGDFKRAGQRSTTKDLSLDTLRTLLADDVDMASRVTNERAAVDAVDDDEDLYRDDPQINDAELDLILDRNKIFSETSIPLEGKMYDVVHDSGPSGGLLANLN
ncbi:hypothetical protein CTAYLR_002446 [Chrysophaeum taylorii]|uniref:Uncharacterized protein n=1 Tax=Chrysophaeum taylorii TaxID=2483200 RepID=A0AAD7XPL2_9STRA|nr:hypothetical protein CTAYLR_002446 [Chrysophaeum taylorii]